MDEWRGVKAEAEELAQEVVKAVGVESRTGRIWTAEAVLRRAVAHGVRLGGDVAVGQPILVYSHRSHIQPIVLIRPRHST